MDPIPFRFCVSDSIFKFISMSSRSRRKNKSKCKCQRESNLQKWKAIRNISKTGAHRIYVIHVYQGFSLLHILPSLDLLLLTVSDRKCVGFSLILLCKSRFGFRTELAKSKKSIDIYTLTHI